MKHRKTAWSTLWVAALLAQTAVGAAAGPDHPAGPSLQPGDSFRLGDRIAMVTKLETLPTVDSDYSRRFRFDSFDNPKLKELRERYKLDDVTAPGRTEFEQQTLLLDWTHRQFKKFGHPSTEARGALEILQAINAGQTFFCSQYAQVFVSAAASLGWVDRSLALRRHQGTARGGSTEHTSTEIWSNQYRKWIMLDPTSNMYLERDGLPLNAYEIRQEWFYRQGTNLVFVIGPERRHFRKSDLPVFLERFAGFGALTVDPDELDKYGFTAFIPNTDLMDSGFDYAKMFIVKDALCNGTQWHQRIVPANPAVDPYFPINQATIHLHQDTNGLNIGFETLTPNFKSLEVRTDGGGWKPAGHSLSWGVQPGRNRLEARTVNQFGRVGPASLVEVEVVAK